MSANALHLNLLNAQERQATSPVQLKYVLPILSGAMLALVVIWGVVVGIQLIVVGSQIDRIRGEIQAHGTQTEEVESLKAKCRNLQAGVDQFRFYEHGRLERGDLFKQLALVIPETITLTALSIPPPPEQSLRPPPGSNLPALQGPTSSVEKVSLRLTGLAQTEQDVFQLMENLKDKSFANQLIITDDTLATDQASPQVLAFRQEAPQADNGKRGVFFDIVYSLKPREFVK